ncbi:MAG TPA: sulfotransferase [Microvirga sp.]|nr:sulfotransferase [Microvirga sp.]
MVIATYGRSGSTLLQKILGSIPGYHITGENFLALHGLFRSFQDAEKTKALKGQKRLTLGDPWRGADRIEPETYGARLVDVFLEEIIKPPKGSRVVGFKEIRFAENLDDLDEFLDFIRTFFNPARIVFNVRNAEDVARSGWWKDHPSETVISLVERFDAQARAYAASYPNEAIVVRYDDYTKNPEELRDLFRFLGEDFDRTLVDDVLKVPLKHLK